MIIEGFVICANAASKNGVEYDLLKSINDTIFKDVVDWTRHPSSLRLELKDFGVWYWKKSKTYDKKMYFERLLKQDIIDEYRQSLTNRMANFDFILSEYEKYQKDKYEVKCLKYGKENYEAYCLAKKQEKIQKAQENKSI